MHAARVSVARLLIGGAWIQNRGRLALTIAAIALGVALGATVHLINHSAATEFETAVRAVSGDADLRVSGPRSGFDEALYPQLARRPEIAVASPMVEIDAKLAEQGKTVRVLGLDPFRALMLQPGLLGEAREHLLDLLQPDAVMLSHAAARQLNAGEGDTVTVQVGLRRVPLRVVAVLPVNDTLRQPLMLMDIAAAQWTFEHLGRLTRIELRLHEGVDPASTIKALTADLPPGLQIVEARQAVQQGLALSRAYRVNLNMLALVSLFTGAVLVFSTQTLSALRRRTHFALLRAIGMSRRELSLLLILEATVFGLIGSAVGLLLGVLAAHVAIQHVGADLGAGFFSGILTRASIDIPGLALIGLSGVVASVLGGALPALEAGRAPPAAALRAGDEERVLARIPRLAPGLAALLLGGALTTLPPVSGLPVFGYAALACLLIGALLLMPAYVERALAALPLPRRATHWLALRQLRGTPGYAGLSLAAILASFSLTVAMLIMIHSFRGSLESWLDAVLPADLYARAGASSSTWLDHAAQERIRSASPVERIAFSRFETVQLAPARPAITLIARDLDPRQPEALPLVSPQRLPDDGSVPAWISEAMRDLYGLDVGSPLRLPLAGSTIEATVAGIWRDYVRQQGTVLVPREAYVAATRDERADEAWIWLRPGVDVTAGAASIRAALGAGTELELREPGVLRKLSLAAFDRTFAVTYALQIAAVVIGLFGVSVGTSAQALARRREFGVLYHVGLSRGELGAMLAAEGGVIGGLGALAGLALGAVMSLVLIHVINRQSFHWSMELHVPAVTLAALAAVLVLCSALTALLSARRVLGEDVVRAVKEDW